ncbi:MAG: hypothetical protein KAH77_02080, partial [Thiomargarita sp.]|nr:hypothetical protein [Thiomargarita sp.]
MKKNDTESEKKRIIKWHHTFGVTLIDYFTHSNYKVDLEKEVSLKKQYLDIAIIRKVAGTPLKEIATGLETLIEYNLFTYKSLREALDRWAIEELIGYYSNYRKIISPSLQKLLPESQFKLYAICTRYPEKLFGNKDLKKEQVDTGLYDITWGARIIQIIVLSQISKKKHNALWQLFSGNSDGFIFGNEHYNWQCPEEKAALNQLFDLYKQEGAKMPYNMIEFTKEFTREHLHLLPHRDRLHGMSAGEVVKQFSVHDVVTQFSTGDRLHGMS